MVLQSMLVELSGYSWRSPVDAAVTLRVRAEDFDPSLRVYTGFDLNELESVPFDVNMSDSGYHEVKFVATTQEAYALRVASSEGDSGIFEIEVTLHTAQFVAPRPASCRPATVARNQFRDLRAKYPATACQDFRA